MTTSAWSFWLSELIKRNSPSELLVIGILAHTAPRILKVGNCISEPIVEMGKSILAGCQQSVSFARGMLWELVDKLCNALPRNPVHEHVDDLAQPIIARSQVELRKKLVQAGSIVGKEIGRLCLIISD